MSRQWISPGQWIEPQYVAGGWGYAYYDGVHRGWARATPLSRLGEATPEEWDGARAEALAALASRRQHARRT
jgi:hypothetical protein